MLKTVIVLILTLIIVPLSAYYFDNSLSAIQTETLLFLLKIMLGIALVTFLLGEFTNNNSQVDKIWSIVPIFYVWIAAYSFDFHPRAVLMASLVTAWGVRLTFNFARRGAYSWKFWEGEEDYRWAILRSKPAFQQKWKWTLFNLFFICLYQNALILLFTLPILFASESSIGIWDNVLATLFIVVLGIELMADQQQWDFHKTKKQLKSENKPLPPIYEKGFVAEGLWAKVRHPNYAAEQTIWLIFYLFSAISTEQWFNWTITGFLLLLLLFQGSSDFSEEISSSKYPKYKAYQELVPRFLPRLFSKKTTKVLAP